MPAQTVDTDKFALTQTSMLESDRHTSFLRGYGFVKHAVAYTRVVVTYTAIAF